MRLPIYQEIKIATFDVMNVIDQMKKSKVGKAPCYIDLLELDEESTEGAIDIMQDALRVLKVSAYFPYPFYIISSYNDIEATIPIVESKNALPKHFMRPVKRMTSKELNQLNKSITLSEKIANTPLAQRQMELKVGTRHNKMLFQLTKEQDFYEQILSELNFKKKN